MYYPYLRGKQFELLALREFAEKNSDNCNVFPIIEPVKKSFSSIKTALKKLQERDIHFAVILNPQVGEMFHKTNDIEIELSDTLANKDKWTPAYIVINTNIASIQAHIRERKYEHIMLICEDSVDTSNPEFDRLITLAGVTSVLISNDNRSLKRKLEKLGKNVIRVDDKFKPQKRNADYLDIPEERFTEEHCYYKADGYYGFADYTVLQSGFSEGGRLPYAVAIHLTYEKNAEEVWVRHFVSDTNDDSSNIQGKFGEAAEKATLFFAQLPYSNYAIGELSEYYIEGQYPGLGMLKKMSIKSHLELMNGILNRIAE